MIISRSVGALCLASVMLAAAPSWSQDNDPLAFSIATKRDACDGRRIEKAYFVEQRRIAVECEGSEVVAVLPANAGAIGAIGAAGLLLLGAFASGGDGGSGSSGSTGSTTGTN